MEPMSQTFVVLLGPPGAGKGTQAKAAAEKLQIPHISTGDLFRDNLKNQTELGKTAQAYMNSGQLVPDEVTIAMVADRISRADCEKGALLDGFPRTIAQAEAFDKMLGEQFGTSICCVPLIELANEVLVSRLSARWMCPQGHVFHEVNNPPKVEGVCDVCGATLYQREDDKAETILRRIEVYENQTAPLIDYYEKKGVLHRVAGDRTIGAVSADILSVIRAGCGLKE